jgi:hypothetical protein
MSTALSPALSSATGHFLFPDTLQSLVGQQNARHGIIKIFKALQETKANKHLLYVSK